MPGGRHKADPARQNDYLYDTFILRDGGQRRFRRAADEVIQIGAGFANADGESIARRLRPVFVGKEFDAAARFGRNGYERNEKEQRDKQSRK